MAVPKLVGFSFGLGEMYPSATKQMGVSSLHESFSGTTKGDNPSKKEGKTFRNFDVNVLGMYGISSEIKKEATNVSYDNNKKPQSKKGTPNKKSKLSKEDPDWLPEQGSPVPNSICKRGSSVLSQNRKIPLMEGIDVSKQYSYENMASHDSLKNLLSSAGWTIVSREGSYDPIYVSPSGSVFGSLPKALEVLSRDSSKQRREKECCLSRSVESSSGHVEERTNKRDNSITRRTRTIIEPISENMALPRQKFGEENEKEASQQSVRMGCSKVHKMMPHDQEKCSIRDESVSSQEVNELDYSNVVMALMAPNSDKCVNDIHQHDKLLGARRPMFVNEKHVPTDSKYDTEMREGEEHTCKPVLMSEGDIVQTPENGKGKVKEALSVPKEMRHGEVHEEMAVNKKQKFSIKDECPNQDKNTSNCGPTVTKNDHNSNADMYQNRECQRVRRSARINGRHVPVDAELDMGMWDVEFYLDSFTSVEMLELDSVIGKEKPDGKENDIEGSLVPEKMRYREVHELMVSCTADEKAESCNSIDTLMQDVLTPKEPDRQNGKEASPIPVEMIFQEVNQVLTSCVADENGKSCTKDDCSSNETEKFGRSNVIVKNDQSGDDKMHQDGELVRTRRSSRINGRRVPVNIETDAEIWASSDFMDFSSFIVNRVVKQNSHTATAATGNMLFKQPSMKNFDYQKARNQKQLERCDGIEIPFHEKCSSSLKNNVAKSVMTEKRSPSRSKRKSVSDRCSNGKKKKKRSGGCSLIVRTGKGDLEETLLSETKVTILSWLIESGILAEYTKVVYKLKEDKRTTLRGTVTRGGIRCNCCKKVLTPLEFEIHAGCNLHQPWNNTYLTSGKSLMQCLSEVWEKEKTERRIGFQTVGTGDADPSDDTCGICADGGHLLCCDACTSTFHQECLMLKSLPEGNWHCPYCSCTFCLKADRGQAKSDGTMSLLSCYQCRCKYHRDCVWEDDKDKMSLDSLLYCGKNCKKVASGLSKFLGASNPIGGGFSWILLRHLDEMESIGSVLTESSILECNARLRLALLVLHECFVPLVDPRTGLDMITQAVYNCGSNFKRLNYEGFYTVILEKDDEIISVATLRLHGTRLAEMPFIGTRPTYRWQGMCRRLLNAIEEMLSSLHVEKLIIPATSDMLETWMKSFSFKQLESSHKDEIRNLNMVLFSDTTLLQKSIYHAKPNKDRDEKQLYIVDGFGQRVNRDYHLLKCAGSQIRDGQDILNCCTPESRRQVFEVATLGPCEEIKTPTSDDDTLRSIISEVSNESVFEVFPVHRPIVQNMDMVSQNLGKRPISLTSDDSVLGLLNRPR